MTKIEDSFEYQAEQAKQTFQNSINALLESHGDFLHKISTAKGSKKTGIWIEMLEAEIITNYIFETVTNLAASYTIINNTNKLLSASNKAYHQSIRNDLRTMLEAFKNNTITKNQLAASVNNYISVRKPNIAAA